MGRPYGTAFSFAPAAAQRPITGGGAAAPSAAPMQSPLATPGMQALTAALAKRAKGLGSSP